MVNLRWYQGLCKIQRLFLCFWQKFTCDSSSDNEFSLKPGDCEWEALQLQTATPHTVTT